MGEERSRAGQKVAACALSLSFARQSPCCRLSSSCLFFSFLICLSAALEPQPQKYHQQLVATTTTTTAAADQRVTGSERQMGARIGRRLSPFRQVACGGSSLQRLSSRPQAQERAASCSATIATLRVAALTRGAAL